MKNERCISNNMQCTSRNGVVILGEILWKLKTLPGRAASKAIFSDQVRVHAIGAH